MVILMYRKSILEVEFLEEEGTGLGPTLEFFALVAAEFQRSGRDLIVLSFCVNNLYVLLFLFHIEK